MPGMSELGPAGGANPFGFMGELMKMFMAEGPINWQLARQAALLTSTGGEPEPNVDPLERLRHEELLRVADLHVADATGLSTSQTGRSVSVRAVTRAEWAYYTLDAYKGLFEGLAAALAPGGSDGTGDQPAAPLDPVTLFAPGVNQDETELLGNLAQVLGTVMLGAQAGTVAGQLARTSFG